MRSAEQAFLEINFATSLATGIDIAKEKGNTNVYNYLAVSRSAKNLDYKKYDELVRKLHKLGANTSIPKPSSLECAITFEAINGSCYLLIDCCEVISIEAYNNLNINSMRNPFTNRDLVDSSFELPAWFVKSIIDNAAKREKLIKSYGSVEGTSTLDILQECFDEFCMSIKEAGAKKEDITVTPYSLLTLFPPKKRMECTPEEDNEANVCRLM